MWRIAVGQNASVRRRLLNLLTLLSLLLCVAVVTLWVRSYGQHSQSEFDRRGVRHVTSQERRPWEPGGAPAKGGRLPAWRNAPGE
jgi:hypothetical protein